MQKTKVVVIHNVVSPHVTKLFQELSRLTDLTVLYCAKGEENRSWNEEVTGFKYKILESYALKFKGKDLFTYFVNPTILKEIRALSPEVVVLAGWDLFAYQLAFFYCKMVGIKVILWSGSTDYEKSWRRTVSLPLVRIIIGGSDAFIAYGKRAEDYLVKNGADSRKVFIYNHTTDTDKYKVKKIPSREPSILYYGQLIERKGVDILINAFSKLKPTVKKLRLTIVGSGKYKSKLVELTNKLNLQGKINFIPDPGDDKVSNFFSKASLFVLPSREEVWGLVVNEAMAAGLPVIVSDVVGSSVDLVNNNVNGYIFRSGSANDLKNKIGLVLKNPNRVRRMGVASERIISEYTPSKSAKIMAEAIHFLRIKNL